MVLGTHDSGTYAINKCMPCASVGKTTRKSIYQQLEIGARYLDIRLGGSGKDSKDVRVYHGFCGAGKFCTSVNHTNLALTDMKEISKNQGE